MCKISIIIPYYDTYDLTDKLLKELTVQKTDDVEVILVDDGCNETRFDKYSKDINIIHLEKNMGASYAWNIGIKASKGDYIAFIDSDDMITMDYIEQLLYITTAYTEDVVIFNWFDLDKNIILIHARNAGIWKALYKREVVPFFDENVRVRTDIPFQRELSRKRPKVAYYNRLLYLYNSNRPGSITWKNKHREEKES